MSTGRRLFGAIVDGFGLQAGRRLFDEALERVAQELGLPPDDPRVAAQAAREAEAARRAADQAAEKERKAAARQAERDRQKAEEDRKERERAVEAELAALKRKLGR